MLKHCSYCHKKFNASANRQMYCSDDCLAESFIIRKAYENQQNYLLKKTKSQSKLKTLNCLKCGSEFTQKSVNQVCCTRKCSVLRNHEISAKERFEKSKGIYVERTKTYYFRANIRRSDFEALCTFLESKDNDFDGFVSDLILSHLDRVGTK